MSNIQNLNFKLCFIAKNLSIMRFYYESYNMANTF